MKHNTNNSRECLILTKDEINHDNTKNNDDTISQDNTISHDDNCILKEDFYSYQVKCIKELRTVKDTFLKNLSSTEQNLKRNLKKNEYNEKYEKTFKSTGKGKLAFER